jgi:hypothetical protein
MFNQEFKKNKLLLHHAHRFYLVYINPVTEPLVLISQIQRSGGSMLSKLIDGHPQLHVHPSELKLVFDEKTKSIGTKTAVAKGTRNNFLLHSDTPHFEELDVDRNQTLDEYEALLNKAVQL